MQAKVLPEIITDHDEILKITIDAFEGIAKKVGMSLDLPPQCALETESLYTEYHPAKSLTGSFTVPSRYSNANGVLQGGFLSAYFDNVMGPLSFLAAKNPTTTVDLTVNCLRPAAIGDELSITATIKAKGINTIHVTAEAINQKGKLVGIASSNLQILRLRK